jgi:hypothetical protein
MRRRPDDAAPFDALARGVLGVAQVYRAVLEEERGLERFPLRLYRSRRSRMLFYRDFRAAR